MKQPFCFILSFILFYSVFLKHRSLTTVGNDILALFVPIRVQTAMGLRLSAAMWWSVPRIHPMGRPGHPGVQGGRPQRSGTSLGEPKGEHLLACVVRHIIIATAKSLWECLHFVVLFNRTEITWRMRKCPVRCGTTTSWTSSKRNEDRSSSSGLFLPTLASSTFDSILVFIAIASFLHVIRFLKLPNGAKRPAADRGGSTEHTPPRDQDFEESSPAYESSEDHFEVSPDRTSPQPPS